MVVYHFIQWICLVYNNKKCWVNKFEFIYIFTCSSFVVFAFKLPVKGTCVFAFWFTIQTFLSLFFWFIFLFISVLWILKQFSTIFQITIFAYTVFAISIAPMNWSEYMVVLVFKNVIKPLFVCVEECNSIVSMYFVIF